MRALVTLLPAHTCETIPGWFKPPSVWHLVMAALASQCMCKHVSLSVLFATTSSIGLSVATYLLKEKLVLWRAKRRHGPCS